MSEAALPTAPAPDVPAAPAVIHSIITAAPAVAAAPYRCSQCGALHRAWLARCEACRQWNSLYDASVVQRIGEVPIKAERRTPTGIGEFDRVLGGGLVPGSVVLLRGEPGAGKSTLLMQAASAFGGDGAVLYGCGEEAPGQVASRARRLGVRSPRVHLTGIPNIRHLIDTALQLRATLVVVDSIQSFADPDLSTAPGTPSQVNAVCRRVTEHAKATGAAILATAHVNADFAVRGGFEIVHQVDASLALERGPLLRVLRADKNRFGDIDEVGLFTMESAGLVEVPSASALWSGDRPGDVPGVAVAAVLEGSRVLLGEVQALVGPAKFGTPRVSCSGFPSDRLAQILAVLERRVKLPRLADSDCFVSVTGGLRLRDPAADLAVALAVASAATDTPLPPDLAAAGEVDLSGRVRPVPRLDDRAKEAQRNGLHLWSAGDAATLAGALEALGIAGRGSGVDATAGAAEK